MSHWLRVSTWRDNKNETVWFKEGEFEKRTTGTNIAPSAASGIPANGTEVVWQPSEEFFTHTEVEIEAIKKLFKTTSCLCPGLTIKLIYNDEKFTYFSSRGLNDLVDEAVKNKELINNRFILNHVDGKNKIDLIMTYTSNYSFTLIPYVNTGLTENGPHITQIKSLITKMFNNFLREKKWLKEKDENLTGDDIQEGMYLVFNITAPGVGYDAQVKSRITKIDMTPFTAPFSEAFKIWCNNNEKEIKNIADKALTARKAREAAKKARDMARDKGAPKGLKAKMQISNKFIDCVNKNPKERNLLLVEGLSAGSSAVEARNVKTDCIYMLRGK